MKNTKVLYGLIIVLLIVIVLISGKLIVSPAKQMTEPETTSMPTQVTSTISPTEQKAIEAWIKANNLNFFGDAADTTYAGGTPLYNEMTGETMERFFYIVKMHPNKPWDN